MKIAGVVRDRKPRKDGKKRGDIIELTPEQKVPLAVQEAIAKEAAEGEVWCSCHEGFKMSDLRFIPNETPLPNSKKFANNTYSAKGEVMWWKTALNSNKKSKAKTSKFKIEFRDVLDYIGQPDIEVKEFSLT